MAAKNVSSGNIEVKPGTVKRLDGWFNLFTGLGTARRDKRMAMQIEWRPLGEQDCEALHAQDDMAAKIVDHIPNEGTREWIEIKKLDEAQLKAICDKIDKLDMVNKLRLAWSWARLYGGSGIFIDAKDGLLDLSKPLSIDTIKTVASLTVLSRYELVGQELESDLSSPNFGLPKYYSLNNRFGAGGIQRIHHTRIIRFEGVTLARNNFVKNAYWGDSVLTRVLNSIRNFNATNDSIASIVQDFRLSIMKMKNLADLVAAGKEDQIKSRIELANMSRSILGTMLLGENEDFQTLSTPIAGLGELVKIGFDRLQAAADMPHTILFGEGSTGSTSGRSETRDFYDKVANQQEVVLTKPINRLLDVCFKAADGPTGGQIPDYSWNFKPLWQLELAEEADLRAKMAEVDTKYIGSGVLDASEVAAARFGPEGFSLETHIDFEARASLDKNLNEPNGTKPGATY